MTTITRSLLDAHNLPWLKPVNKIPVIAMIVPPIHIAVGIVQVVAGIAIGVFAGLGALITNSKFLKEVAKDSGKLMLKGGVSIVISIVISVIYILTLGLLVLCVKQ